MCDTNTIDDLENGGGESLRVQSRALAQLMRASNGMQQQMSKMQARLAAIPVRSEVREIVRENISVHSDSCANARKSSVPSAPSKPEENKVELAVGKILGFKASGKLGMFLSAAFWIAVGIVICVAIFHANELSVLYPKGATP